MKTIVTALSAMLLAGCTSTYLVRGEGGVTCADVLKQIENDRNARVVYGAWLTGYVTRYNYERDSKLSRDFKSDTLVEAAMVYCKGKPLDDFSEAAELVIKELARKKSGKN